MKLEKISGGQTNVSRIEGDRRLELKLLTSDWLKLRGGKTIFRGGGGEMPLLKTLPLFRTP